jgi:hypothetical protein
MPLQNRVTPFGTIIADPAKGTLMGNRGRIHDAATRTLTTRRWTTRAWIICLCAFNDRPRRTLMGPGSYTELFFLDEATALAAGHRPCFECQRTRAREFHAAYCFGNGWTPGRVGPMDDRLHEERLSPRPSIDAAALPTLVDGTMVASGEAAFVWLAGRLHPWSMAGYGPAEPVVPHDLRLLTPPSTLAALKAGFAPDIHPSARR